MINPSKLFSCLEKICVKNTFNFLLGLKNVILRNLSSQMAKKNIFRGNLISRVAPIFCDITKISFNENFFQSSSFLYKICHGTVLCRVTVRVCWCILESADVIMMLLWRQRSFLGTSKYYIFMHVFKYLKRRKSRA